MHNTNNLYEIIRSFSASTRSAFGLGVIRDIYVGSEFDYDKTTDIKFPAVLIEFPISFSVSEPTKTYNLAFQVIDRIDLEQNSNDISLFGQSDMVNISSKVEMIGHAIYKVNSDIFEKSGYTMSNIYTGIIDVEKFKDYTVRSRFEFDLQVPLNQCLFL
jgi:hypothetical protein